ncbi:serine-rich adhesin for platelets [Penaeus vannamei]
MDLQIEASDASRNEVEVGGGVSEEKLGKQLQVVDVGNQECGDVKETLKDAKVSDCARQSEQPTMGSGESKCGVQANGEAFANGVREEGAASGGDPSVAINSKDFSVAPDTQQQEVSPNKNDEEENKFKVTELINEILHQSSYLEDSNLNGLEFADTLPGEMDAADLNIAVKSSSHVLYLNHREENGSSPDSDSNMTTASEGSSTPTSELSSTSIHSSDQQNFINTQDARVLTHLICSNNLADPDCRIEDKLSNECNPKLLLEVSVPDCINDLDALSVKETILESKDSSILVMELIGETAVPQTSSENVSIKGCPDAEAVKVECVDFDEGVNLDINISQEKDTLSDQNHSIVVNSSEIEVSNTQQKGLVEELEPVGDDDVGQETDGKNSDITVKSVIQTFTETTDMSENTAEVSENKTCTKVADSENMEGEALGDTEFADVISTETRSRNINVADAEVETESERNQEINETNQPEESDSINLEVFGDQVSTSTSTIISDEGRDVESEKGSMETGNQMTKEHITTDLENSVEKSDITEAVTALETLSLTVEEPEKSIQRIESQSAESSGFENTNVMKQNMIDNECDGKVLCEVESSELSGEIKPVITSNKKGKEENIASEYDCACRRNETTDEGGNVMVGVWAELRSSLRQLHRSMIPQSSQVLIQRSRPSINRIKALANMLVNHDAHQLYLRISHLAHELCIELKVRLLATIHDSPTPKEATAFIQGICDSYQWVMSVCEALHPALERLDSEHLSRFKLNWVTVNMHVFHSTILTDPDVHDYAQICKEKFRETPGGEDVLSCLASLHRTLAVAEAVWVRADTLLQEYAIERAALSARRRQLLADWEQFKAQQRTQQQEAAKAGVPNLASTSAALSEDGGAQCPCDDCVNGRTGQLEGQPLSGNARIALSSSPDVRSPSSCECHFCNASMAAATNEEPVLPPSSGSSLPPLAQPQLSLYPHIHNTPPGSDIVGTGQSREELGPIPPAPSTKPPITTNPYLGSDLLTEQLMREWELVYGDALTPPGSHPILPPPPDAVIQHYEGDPSSLVSGVETMRISSSRPSYTRAMVDPSMPYVPDSCTTARAHTTILPSSQPSANAADHTVSSAHSVAKVPVSSRSSTPSCEGSVSAIIPDVITASGKSCCTTSNTTSVITHTHAHHTHTTATAQKGKCLGKVEEIRKRQLDRADTSTSRESVGESETSGGDEWSSGDETDSSTTVSSTHQDPHCDCCYCHMLHHKQGGGRQKYSDRRERLLKILSRKKNARNNAVCPNTSSANAVTAASDSTEVPTSTGGTPLGGQNIDKIMDYIEGNQTDEAKRAKKAAKKARQRQKKLALKKEKKEEKKMKLEDKKGECEEEEEEEEEVEDGPLAELRRRAPDVTITVVRPGQQTSRTASSPQMAFQRPRDPSPPAMEVYKPPQAKLVPSLAQSSEELSSQSQSSSRTILHPSRHSTQGRQPQSQPGKHFAASAPSFSNRESAERTMANGGEQGGLSNILKAMDTSGKEKDKGSQMVTIRRVMDPNSAEPTVTITLKGEQPEKDKVLFKLINGQAVAGNGGSGQGGKKSSKSQKNSKPQAQPYSKAQPKLQPNPNLLNQ